MTARKGITLMEVIVSLSMLVLLMGMVVGLYIFSMRSARVNYRHLDELSSFQEVAGSFQRDLEPAARLSVSTSKTPPVLAMLTGESDETKLVISPEGHIEWQKYVVYYLNTDEKTLHRREIKLGPAAIQRQTPTHLEELENRPLADYVVEGRTIMRDVTAFEAAKVGARLVRVRLKVEKNPEQPAAEMDCTWRVHN